MSGAYIFMNYLKRGTAFLEAMFLLADRVKENPIKKGQVVFQKIPGEKNYYLVRTLTGYEIRQSHGREKLYSSSDSLGVYCVPRLLEKYYKLLEKEETS